MQNSATAIFRKQRLSGRQVFVGLIVLFAVSAEPLIARADEVDDLIAARMQEHHISGLSLAIVQDGKIFRAQGYGFTQKDGQIR